MNDSKCGGFLSVMGIRGKEKPNELVGQGLVHWRGQRTKPVTIAFEENDRFLIESLIHIGILFIP